MGASSQDNVLLLGEEDSETLSEPSAKRMKIQEGEAGQEKEQEKEQEAANGEAEEEEKRAENGEAAVEENGEVAKKNEEQQEIEEEEKENDSSEKVKNGTKENGRKAEAAPSETKTGKFVKSLKIRIDCKLDCNTVKHP